MWNWNPQVHVIPHGLDGKKQRREWLGDLGKVLAAAKLAEKVDKRMEGTDGWITTAELRGTNVYNMHLESRLEAFERHLFLRYVLTCFESGQQPVEFQQLPSSGPDCHRCRSCRASRVVMNFDEDLSDEEDCNRWF